MRTVEREKLYEEIKEYALEEFNVELSNKELSEYSETELEKTIHKMKDIMSSGEKRWLLAYVDGMAIDFMEAMFTFDKYSVYCDFPNVDSTVKDELFYEISERAIDGVLENLDCGQYLIDCMDFDYTKYGYIRSC